MVDGRIEIIDCSAPVEVMLINKKNNRFLAYCKEHWKRDSKGVLLTIFAEDEMQYSCSSDIFDIIVDEKELEVATILYE